MSYASLVFAGELEIARFPEVHGALEAAKASKGVPVLVDLSQVGGVDPMIAADIVLFIRRALRYGATVAVVPPPRGDEWLTRAASIHGAQFRRSPAEALHVVNDALGKPPPR